MKCSRTDRFIHDLDVRIYVSVTGRYKRPYCIIHKPIEFVWSRS